MMGMGNMMWLMLLITVIIGVLIIIGAILLIRLIWDKTTGEKRKNTAMSILQERFARGEIDTQEYQEHLDALQRKENGSKTHDYKR